MKTKTITQIGIFAITLLLAMNLVSATNLAHISSIYDDTGSSPWIEIDAGCTATTSINGVDSSGTITCTADSGSGSMSSFTLAGDSGTQTIDDDDDLDIAGGTGITTATSATDTVTITASFGASIDTGEITDDTIIPADLYTGGHAPAANDFLTYESTGTTLYWESCTEYLGATLCDKSDATTDGIASEANINACTITGEDVVCSDCVKLTTETAGNYVYGISASTDITVSGSAAEGWTATVGITADSVDADSLADIIYVDSVFVFDGAAGAYEVKVCDATCGTNTNAQAAGELYVDNDLEVDGNIYGFGADLAEMIASKDLSLEPGEVVIIDINNPVNVKRSEGKYDKLLAGVISTNPGITLGTEVHPAGFELALTGQVPVKVTNENGPIKRGDILTTSSTPGHAMKCDDLSKCQGAIIGKALEPLNNEKGTIMTLLKLS